MSASIDLPGFADPVTEAQATFRAVLDAMARPGTIHRAGQHLAAPAPFDGATAAVLLTLVDHETPLWLDAEAAPARDWLAFHCGAVLVPEPDTACFAVALSLPDLARFSAGSHEAPEGSATVVLQVPALASGTRYRLSGPGLREPEELSVTGLPPWFITQWQQNRTLFPRGLDVILCAGTMLTALPRSVSIEEG
jgi:alpha-D-ribose 1-methylphosphonate 5-triphosphate synthase subunit PhnH